MPSADWAKSASVIGTPVAVILGLLCGAIVALNTKKIDAWRVSREKAQGQQTNARANLTAKTAIGSFLIRSFIILLGPISFAVGPLMLIPMVLAQVSKGPVALEYTITDVDQFNRDRAITFESSWFLWMQLPFPPEGIHHEAEVGDTLILYGLGNQFGVYYSSMALRAQSLNTD